MIEYTDPLEAMRQGVDYTFLVSIRKWSVRLRPLSVIETIQVTQTLKRRIKEAGDGATALLEHTILAQEHLTVASTSDVGANDPKLTSYMLERLTPDELASLHKQYVMGCDKVNPSLEYMKPGDVNKLVTELKKSSEDPVELGYQLTELSFYQLASLVQAFLAADERQPDRPSGGSSIPS